jgi:hypothetical protein
MYCLICLGIFVSFNDGISNQTTGLQIGLLMDTDLENVWKEAFVTTFKVLVCHSDGGTEKEPRNISPP